MPEIVKTDIVDELHAMASLMRRGHYASSAHDAEFIVEAAAKEIERLRWRVRENDDAWSEDSEVLARLSHLEPESYRKVLLELEGYDQ